MKKFVNNVNKNAADDAFNASIGDAESLFIIPAIGPELYEVLSDEYNAGPLSEENTRLMKLLQPALAHYTMYMDLQTRIGTVGNAGYVENAPERTMQVRQWVHYGSCKNHFFIAESYLDKAIELMESKVGTEESYEAWQNSAAYTFTKELFISGTADFQLNGKVDIGNSRSTWLALRPWVDIGEAMFIRPILTEALFEDLKTKVKTGELSGEEKALLAKIKPALAQWAISEGLGSLAISKQGGSIKVITTNDAITQTLLAPVDQVSALKITHRRNADTFGNLLVDYLDAKSTAELFPSYYEKVKAANNLKVKAIYKNEDSKSCML